MNRDIVSRLTLVMPDGELLGVVVFEDELVKDKIKQTVNNWYKVTNKEPERFDHFNIKDKCPKCGGHMRCKMLKDQTRVWCMNPDCGYQGIEEGLKSRDRVFEKHGLKVKWVKKTGASVIMSNRQVEQRNRTKK